ncbi:MULTISPECIES: DinB family protein [unclassified Duganella]|uniref:DinB family protein n=1 Tax=unclassified Duganella TaxID=2636909 RepID=UPI0006F912E6|nr:MULTISPECIES: DinB family protein [unclassified Duganella]KQV44713.1 diguanylate cyclase [Duganella sp. Root336D2]KRB83235.1 diguanylate cyclase [Duganella sp. Root198D2]
MSRTAHITLLARYNDWMNNKLYEAAATLPAEELAADRGAFFGSLLATLNHIAVADTIWLKRIASHPRFAAALAPVAALPAPAALDQPLFDALGALRERRIWLDRLILDWSAGLDEADLDAVITYRRFNGEANHRQLGLLLLHFFNHQTHHRGQATTLLSQAGVDVGVTDLLALVPEAAM